METVTFQCSHCGNLMAVTTDLVGEHVRCPHCQQVVVAPSPLAPTVLLPNPTAPPPIPDLSFSVQRDLHDHESIFGEGGEDLFGGPPKARLELPPELTATHMELCLTNFPASPPLAPTPATLPTPGNLLETTESPTSVVLTSVLSPDGVSVAAHLEEQAAEATIGNLTDLWPEEISSDPSQALARPVSGVGRVFYWLAVFLVPYSIFITGVAIMYYVMYLKKPDPLEALPDIMGNFKDTTKKGTGPRSYQLPAHDSPLPDKLRVGLGQPVRIGDLETVAEMVEQKPVTFFYRGRVHDPEEGTSNSLFLHLRLRNVSRDVFFHATDPYFDRRWVRERDALPPPYTYLEAGSKRFYGGAVPWNRKEGLPHKYVQGQEEHETELKPGEELQTMICTDPDADVPKQLRGYRGNLLWRVQLRRGLLRVGDSDYPVTAVIGVEFTMKDISR